MVFDRQLAVMMHIYGFVERKRCGLQRLNLFLLYYITWFGYLLLTWTWVFFSHLTELPSITYYESKEVSKWMLGARRLGAVSRNSLVSIVVTSTGVYSLRDTTWHSRPHKSTAPEPQIILRRRGETEDQVRELRDHRCARKVPRKTLHTTDAILLVS